MSEGKRSKLRLVGYVFCAIVFTYILFKRPLIVSHNTQAPLLSDDASQGEKGKSVAGSLHGIDVSHDQGKVNWTSVAHSDIKFVYLKATDGMTYQDPDFKANSDALAQINDSAERIWVGAYHFFEAEDDPAKQAQNFLLSLADNNLTLAPMIDVEITRGVPADEIKKRLKTLLKIIEESTDCKPVLYSYGDFWKANIGEGFNEYPFWLADYDGAMTVPDGLKNLVLWQHSETGHVEGINGHVDLDIVVDEARLKDIKCHGKKEVK